MLFNSYEFILLFLPITVFIFYKLGEHNNKRLPIFWLTSASLFFYGWWNPPYLGLLLISIGINYTLSQVLIETNQENISFVVVKEKVASLIRREGGGTTQTICKPDTPTAHISGNERWSKQLLLVGIIFNLGLLGYYKYSNFFLDTLNTTFNTSFNSLQIILPLGISFYTFQQIAYLIDSLEGETKGYKFIDYCLFVSFFPQLIAGPIVSHQEMMPQFAKRSTFKLDPEDISVGVSIFSIGLFKKVVLADQIALYATPVFNAASQGVPLTIFEAWVGALAYMLQIYFDFSGYSDMAIGAARMFGIKLPLNFDSPYKAFNIIDYWSRFHMTLTRFLTRYVYNPIALSMSRRRMRLGKSLIKRGVGSPTAFLELVAVPTIITMFLSGFWHGAGWQYIIFGILHGFYLAINQGWHMIQKWMKRDLKRISWWEQRLGQLITLIAVIIALLFFRADSVNTAIKMLNPMLGMQGIPLPKSLETYFGGLKNLGVSFSGIFSNSVLEKPSIGIALIVTLLAIALLLPNTQQLMRKYQPGINYNSSHKDKHQSKWLMHIGQYFEWHPTHTWGWMTAIMMLASIFSLSNASEFIYFHF